MLTQYNITITSHSPLPPPPPPSWPQVNFEGFLKLMFIYIQHSIQLHTHGQCHLKSTPILAARFFELLPAQVKTVEHQLWHSVHCCPLFLVSDVTSSGYKWVIDLRRVWGFPLVATSTAAPCIWLSSPLIISVTLLSFQKLRGGFLSWIITISPGSGDLGVSTLSMILYHSLKGTLLSIYSSSPPEYL